MNDHLPSDHARAPDHSAPNHTPQSSFDHGNHATEATTKSTLNTMHFQPLTSTLPASPPHSPLQSEYALMEEECSTHTPLFELQNDGLPHPPSSLDVAAAALAAPSLSALKSFTFDQFHLVKTVGTGSFGRVILVKDKEPQTGDNPSYYALKIMNKMVIIRNKQIEHINNERKVLAATRHPFLVALYGTFQDQANLFMVLSWVPGGELFTILRQQKSFNEDTSRFYASQILLALSYLHDQQIIYRDLKPENILIDDKGYLKLTDFGFAKFVTDVTWTLCGTPDYLAPEILRSKGYGKSVDYWALGVLIYEMVAGRPPFVGSNQFQLYEKIVMCQPEYPPSFSADLRHLLAHLLTSDLSQRYGNLKNGSRDVFEHPWFACIDFDKLLAYELPAPFVPALGHDGDTSNFDNYPEEVITDRAALPEKFNKYFTAF
ncbi:kinase-like domain-containing protein [Gongronella butleri]|nr:kinase-like domain-containing protein [Gongronella butleri]